MGHRTAQGLKNKTFANRNMILYSNHAVDSSLRTTVMDLAIIELAKTEDVIVRVARPPMNFLPFIDAVIQDNYQLKITTCPRAEFHITDEMTVRRIPVHSGIVEYITLPIRKEIVWTLDQAQRAIHLQNPIKLSPHGFVVDGVECLNGRILAIINSKILRCKSLRLHARRKSRKSKGKKKMVENTNPLLARRSYPTRFRALPESIR